MTEEIFEIGEQENLPNANIDLDTFKSMYYLQNVKPDSQIKFFKERKRIEISDILQLKERLNSKIEIHQVETYIASISFTLDDGNIRDYGAWAEFEREKWEHINQTITSINITWDLTFSLPKFKLPQKHTLKVRLGNSIAPKDMFQMMFTSDEPTELMESRAEGLVKVDFINRIISNELIKIVADWHEGLKKIEPQNSFITFLEKKQHYILSFVANSTPVFLLFLAYIYQNLLCDKFGYSKDLNLISFQRSILVLVFIYVIGLLIGKSLATWLNKKINGFDYPTGFYITKGDINSFDELTSNNVKIKKEIIGKMLIAIVSGVVTVITKIIIEKYL